MRSKIKCYADYKAAFNSYNGYQYLSEFKKENPKRYEEYKKQREKEELRKNNYTEYILRYGPHEINNHTEGSDTNVNR